MTTIELAQFLSTVGFVGFAGGSAYWSITAALDSMDNRKRAILCLGLFVAMFAAISAIGQLSRPPFEWIDAEAVAVASGVVIWLTFIFAVIGTWRNAP